ncbi:MAG TPA: tetratricopeptide repeat protein [Methylomirabilota bacterium]|nr:tetratricopeptide repeat protein [Methylomirabilota bacterium]
MNSEYFPVTSMWQDRAESGDAAAQFQLGYCYDMGQGAPVDIEAACHWYQRAAAQGHARAQHHLGLAFSNGLGVEWNLAEACKWLTLASRNGIAEAAEALQALKIPPDQRAEGERMASRFAPASAIQTDVPRTRRVVEPPPASAALSVRAIQTHLPLD